MFKRKDWKEEINHIYYNKYKLLLDRVAAPIVKKWQSKVDVVHNANRITYVKLTKAPTSVTIMGKEFNEIDIINKLFISTEEDSLDFANKEMHKEIWDSEAVIGLRKQYLSDTRCYLVTEEQSTYTWKLFKDGIDSLSIEAPALWTFTPDEK